MKLPKRTCCITLHLFWLAKLRDDSSVERLGWPTIALQRFAVSREYCAVTVDLFEKQCNVIYLFKVPEVKVESTSQIFDFLEVRF